MGSGSSKSGIKKEKKKRGGGYRFCIQSNDNNMLKKYWSVKNDQGLNGNLNIYQRDLRDKKLLLFSAELSNGKIIRVTKFPAENGIYTGEVLHGDICGQGEISNSKYKFVGHFDMGCIPKDGKVYRHMTDDDHGHFKCCFVGTVRKFTNTSYEPVAGTELYEDEKTPRFRGTYVYGQRSEGEEYNRSGSKSFEGSYSDGEKHDGTMFYNNYTVRSFNFMDSSQDRIYSYHRDQKISIIVTNGSILRYSYNGRVVLKMNTESKRGVIFDETSDIIIVANMVANLDQARFTINSGKGWVRCDDDDETIEDIDFEKDDYIEDDRTSNVTIAYSNYHTYRGEIDLQEDRIMESMIADRRWIINDNMVFISNRTDKDRRYYYGKMKNRDDGSVYSQGTYDTQSRISPVSQQSEFNFNLVEGTLFSFSDKGKRTCSGKFCGGILIDGYIKEEDGRMVSEGVYHKNGAIRHGKIYDEHGQVKSDGFYGENGFMTQGQKYTRLPSSSSSNERILESDGDYDEHGQIVRGRLYNGSTTWYKGEFKNGRISQGKIYVNDILTKEGSFDEDGEFICGSIRIYDRMVQIDNMDEYQNVKESVRLQIEQEKREAEAERRRRVEEEERRRRLIEEEEQRRKREAEAAAGRRRHGGSHFNGGYNNRSSRGGGGGDSMVTNMITGALIGDALDDGRINGSAGMFTGGMLGAATGSGLAGGLMGGLMGGGGGGGSGFGGFGF